jgi:hypothetical protein
MSPAIGNQAKLATVAGAVSRCAPGLKRLKPNKTGADIVEKWSLPITVEPRGPRCRSRKAPSRPGNFPGVESIRENGAHTSAAKGGDALGCSRQPLNTTRHGDSRDDSINRL